MVAKSGISPTGIINSTASEVLASNLDKVYRWGIGNGYKMSKRWYETAHNDCLAIAKEFGYSLSTICGMVAVTSPKMPWGWNIASVIRILQGQRSTAFLSNELKAIAIMQGGDPLDVISGPKTRSFYSNLLNAGLDDAVTIDMWMVRSTMGTEYHDPTVKMQGISDKCYENIADVVRQQAKQAGLTGAQYQAIVWDSIKAMTGWTLEEQQLPRGWNIDLADYISQ